MIFLVCGRNLKLNSFLMEGGAAFGLYNLFDQCISNYCVCVVDGVGACLKCFFRSYSVNVQFLYAINSKVTFFETTFH